MSRRVCAYDHVGGHMATLNIYLPDELKAEMERMEGANWSQVCQQAIRYELLSYHARRTMNVEAIAERIRATAGAHSKKYQQGFNDGKSWAAQEANVDEMEAMLSIESYDKLRGSELGGRLFSFMSALEWEKWHWGDVQPQSEKYLEGFVDGALKVFKEVRSLL